MIGNQAEIMVHISLLNYSNTDTQLLEDDH